jgi:hypothetical protein
MTYKDSDLPILTDGIKNLLTKLGSEVDPTIHEIVRNCPVNMKDWVRNGGVAEKICKFWATQMSTGVKIEVIPQRESGRNKVAVEALQTYLTNEFQRLNVVPKFAEAKFQCSIGIGAPIVIITDGYKEHLWDSPQQFNKIERIQILNPRKFHPDVQIIAEAGGIDLDNVEYYHAVAAAGSLGGNNLIHKDRVLPLQGRKLTCIETSSDVFELYWGLPSIGTAVVKAALVVDVLMAYGETLVAYKNHIDIGIKGFNQGMQGGNREKYEEDVLATLKAYQKMLGLLGIRVHDKEDETKTIERNLSGVPEMIQEARANLLMHCPNIPESWLLGRKSTGGLTTADKEDEQVDSIANQLWQLEHYPQLMRLVEVLLRSGNCPSRNWPISNIKLTRVSGSIPEPLNNARTRLINAQAEKIEIEVEKVKNGVVVP